MFATHDLLLPKFEIFAVLSAVLEVNDLGHVQQILQYVGTRSADVSRGIAQLSNVCSYSYRCPGSSQYSAEAVREILNDKSSITPRNPQPLQLLPATGEKGCGGSHARQQPSNRRATGRTRRLQDL